MYENPMLKQQPVRDKLGENMLKEGTGLLDTAAKIGICHTTLSHFMSKGKNVKIKTLSKIINYIEAKRCEPNDEK
jgi:DNA-binding Xre family transcriptional regulator